MINSTYIKLFILFMLLWLFGGVKNMNYTITIIDIFLVLVIGYDGIIQNTIKRKKYITTSKKILYCIHSKKSYYKLIPIFLLIIFNLDIFLEITNHKILFKNIDNDEKIFWSLF